MTQTITKLACFAVLALAGCARDNTDYRANGLGSSILGQQGVIASSVPPTAAAAMLAPAAGRVIQVSERRYADGVAQEIVLAGDRGSHGENRIDISMRLKQAGDQVYDNLIPLHNPSETDIAAELEERFPGMNMQMVNVLLQNRYGPYGLAAGKRGANERCIYAWQWIDDIAGPPSPRISSLSNAILSPPLPASIRVRLCRTGVSADQLAGLMDGISVGAGMGNRQFPILGQQSAQGVAFGNDALTAAGSLGGQTFAGYQLPQIQTLDAPQPSVRVARHTQQRVAARHRGRRRMVQRPPALEAEPQFARPMPQQYYSPQPPPYAPQSYAPPVAPARGIRPLDQSLPSQAYAGPNGASVVPQLTAPSPGPVYNNPTSAPAPTRRLLRDPNVQGAGI